MDVMTGYLSVVFQGSGESEEVSTDWKLTNSIQIYKKGLRKDPGTYRPVRLTSVRFPLSTWKNGENDSVFC